MHIWIPLPLSASGESRFFPSRQCWNSQKQELPFWIRLGMWIFQQRWNVPCRFWTMQCFWLTVQMVCRDIRWLYGNCLSGTRSPHLFLWTKWTRMERITMLFWPNWKKGWMRTAWIFQKMKILMEIWNRNYRLVKKKSRIWWKINFLKNFWRALLCVTRNCWKNIWKQEKYPGERLPVWSQIERFFHAILALHWKWKE